MRLWLLLPFLLAGCAKVAVPPEFINVDAGLGAALRTDGRAVIASWNAGEKRKGQVVCAEPSDRLGAAIWRRYELCLAYANGILSREAYAEKLEAEFKAELAREQSPLAETSDMRKAEAEKLRAEAERFRADAEKLRRDAEARLADADKARADADKTRAEAEVLRNPPQRPRKP